MSISDFIKAEKSAYFVDGIRVVPVSLPVLKKVKGFVVRHNGTPTIFISTLIPFSEQTSVLRRLIEAEHRRAARKTCGTNAGKTVYQITPRKVFNGH